MSAQVNDRLQKLTQRLDHSVPDTRLSFQENRMAAVELASISDKLQELLPDSSLSPFERVERIARALDDRRVETEHLQPAAAKVARLKERLDELVPGDSTPERKIETLVAKLDDLVSADQRDLPAGAKLEILGDPQGRVEPETHRSAEA